MGTNGYIVFEWKRKLFEAHAAASQLRQVGNYCVVVLFSMLFLFSSVDFAFFHEREYFVLL